MDDWPTVVSIRLPKRLFEAGYYADYSRTFGANYVIHTYSPARFDYEWGAWRPQLIATQAAEPDMSPFRREEIAVARINRWIEERTPKLDALILALESGV